MNLFLVAHDPDSDSDTVRVYDMELRALIEPTGQVDEHGRREVRVDSAEREFVDRSVGSALAEVLDLARPGRPGDDPEGDSP